MYGPILKGKKAILQPPKLSEAKTYLQWLRDEEIIRFLDNDYKNLTLKKEKEYLNITKKDKEKIMWSIYTKEGKHIGSTDLHKLNKDSKKTSWGILIGDKEEWGKGYGTDVLNTILKYSFNKLKLNRFELSVFDGNIGGIKCYTRCGLKKEGVKRQSKFKNDKYLDEIIMSILKNEYKNK